MRVRKSVPEGYKTGGYSAFELFSDNPSASYGNFKKESEGLGSRTTMDSSIGYRGPNELTPFCGIMKVGGLGVQQNTSLSQVQGEDDIPFLSSQGSTISNVSIDSIDEDRGNKRRFGEEEDDEERSEIWQDRSWDFEALSPKSKPRVLEMGRAMAIPRSKRKSLTVRNVSSTGAGYKFATLGQENVGMDVAMDFEEAEFLDYGVLEVEMGDA
jgi:hypothetical protein